MKTILNLSALKKLMKVKPIGQRLWFFFQIKGYRNDLTKAQCKDILSIIEKEHKKTIDYITEKMNECIN